MYYREAYPPAACYAFYCVQLLPLDLQLHRLVSECKATKARTSDQEDLERFALGANSGLFRCEQTSLLLSTERYRDVSAHGTPATLMHDAAKLIFNRYTYF